LVFKNIKKISNDLNWVNIISKNQIKYYYYNIHNKPIIEYTFKDDEIIQMFNKYNWILINHNRQDIDYKNDSNWIKYLKCFDTLVFSF
jgi:predicted adenine nucleotide alpha hydrolase (AANH) superfamily ATPase